MAIDGLLRPIRATAITNWIYLLVGAGLVALLRPVQRGDLLSVGTWLTSMIPVPRWLFVLSLTVGTVIGIMGILASRVPKPARQGFRNYSHDELEGVRWRWAWLEDTSTPTVDTNLLIATCQGCGDRMHETLVEADGFEHLALTCRSCDRVAYELPVSMYEAFIAKIASEVEHRARSIDP